MILVKQVVRAEGRITLYLDVDFPDGTVKTVELDAAEIEERLKLVSQLLGRKPTKADLRDIVKALISKVREGAKPPSPWSFDYVEFAGLDFESGGLT